MASVPQILPGQLTRLTPKARVRPAQADPAESRIAQFGTLDPLVARDIAVLREFSANRERHLRRLFGRNLRRNATRDELLRIIMLVFSEGKSKRVAFFVRACASYATGPSVRNEIELLSQAGLIVLTRDATHSKALTVEPTVKLVRFYNEQMPRLREEVLQILAREPGVGRQAVA